MKIKLKFKKYNTFVVASLLVSWVEDHVDAFAIRLVPPQMTSCLQTHHIDSQKVSKFTVEVSV